MSNLASFIVGLAIGVSIAATQRYEVVKLRALAADLAAELASEGRWADYYAAMTNRLRAQLDQRD